MKSAIISSLLLSLSLTAPAHAYRPLGFGSTVASNPCTTDDDCSAGTWCRAKDEAETARECVAYAKIGEACGGFVPFWEQEKCHPLMTCKMDGMNPDASGTCAANIVTPGPDVRFQEMAVDSLKECLMAVVAQHGSDQIDETTSTAAATTNDLDMSALMELASIESTITSCGDIGVEFNSAHVRVLRRSDASVLAEVQYDCDGNEVSPQCNVQEDDEPIDDTSGGASSSDSSETEEMEENKESDESTTTTTPAASDLNTDSSDELSDGAVVGLIVASGVFGVAILVALVYCMGNRTSNTVPAAASEKASGVNDKSDGNSDNDDEETGSGDIESGSAQS